MTYSDAQYLVIGVEDGWIHITPAVWKEYLVAKKIVEMENGN